MLREDQMVEPKNTPQKVVKLEKLHKGLKPSPMTPAPKQPGPGTGNAPAQPAPKK